MSEFTMARRIANRSVPGINLAGDTTKSQLEKTLGYLTAYIPMSVVTGFIPVWSALVASEVPATAENPAVVVAASTKFTVALITTILGGAVVWGLGHAKARKAAKDANKPIPEPIATLMAGKVDILFAVVATFAWTSISPSNWAGIREQFMILGIAVAVGGFLTVAAMFRDED